VLKSPHYANPQTVIGHLRKKYSNNFKHQQPANNLKNQSKNFVINFLEKNHTNKYKKLSEKTG
jgi:hypothetical protein